MAEEVRCLRWYGGGMKVVEKKKKALVLLVLAVGLSKLIDFILDEAYQPGDLSDLSNSLCADALRN